MNKSLVGVGIAVCLSYNLVVASAAKSDNAPKPANQSAATLTDGESRAIAYLVAQQNKDGSWSQGEESQYMRSVGQGNGDIHNVADTCMAAMALLRAGNLPDHGKYADNLARAADYVCGNIEQADENSLFITTVRGTRVQYKLGQYVDTFLASMFLPEMKGHMKSPDENERVATALRKVVHKIEKNQGADGQFANGGWAPIHSQSMAMQGLNSAAASGIPVSPKALSIANAYAQKGFDETTRSFGAAGSAGVPLYSAAATLGALQSSIDHGKTIRHQLAQVAESPSAPMPQKLEAKKAIADYDVSEREQAAALSAVRSKLNDKQFVSGFGCNGGEEFLSYLQISQSLIANKSKDWDDWNKNVSSNLYRVQNQDGSWMGQHCITSRTFCTATALQVLLADRATSNKPVSVSAK
jgi:hypothetical protein